MKSTAKSCDTTPSSASTLEPLKKCAINAVTAFILAAELSVSGMLVDAFAEESKELYAPNTLTGIQDVRALVVESSTNTGGMSTSEIEKAIKQADKTIRFATAGAMGLGTVAIETVLAEPEESAEVDGLERPCYSEDQINKAYKHMLADTPSSIGESSTQYMVFFQDGSSCVKYQKKVAAYATKLGEYPLTVYNSIGRAKYSTLLPNVIGHELGHTWGLGHAPRIVCTTQEGIQFLMDSSVQQQIQDGCTTEKKPDGSVNEYASVQTIMGNSWTADMSGLSIPYSAVEMSKLNPEFHIETVEPTSGVHQIAMEPGKPVGIRMMLPADHALKGVVNGADAVVFALNDNGGWWGKPKKGEEISVSDPRIDYELNTYITSTNNNEVVSLDTAGNGPLASRAEFEELFGSENEEVLVEPSPVFIDEQLGVRIRFGMNKDGYFIDVKEI